MRRYLSSRDVAQIGGRRKSTRSRRSGRSVEDNHTPRDHLLRHAHQARAEGVRAIAQRQQQPNQQANPRGDRVTAKSLELWFRERWKEEWEKLGQERERAGVTHTMDGHLEAAVQGAHAPREHATSHRGHRTECLLFPNRSPRSLPKLLLRNTERNTQTRGHLLPEQGHKPSGDDARSRHNKLP
jgi:hypothetical protein